MRVLVYGAGAVGSYVGGSLASAGHEVTLVVRPNAAETISKSGLRLSHPDKPDVLADVALVTSVRQAFLDDESYDLIVLGMKSYDVSEALNPLIAFCPQPFPPLLTLQNGIGIEEMIMEDLNALLIAGSLTTPVSRQTPDHIEVERSGRGLALAPTRERQDIRRWVQTFAEAGIPTQRIKNYRAMKWSKALLNMMGNASSAIINRHPKAIYSHDPTYDLEMEMLSEALKVMRRLKLKVVDLPGTPTTRLSLAVRRLPDFIVKPVLTRMVAGGRGNKLPSFHLDLSAGRKDNEVRFHNGAVAEAGRELGVATPVNEALATILLGMVRGEIDWHVYDGNPGRLIEEVEKYR
ncbi:MAG TPA: 2-dehydropantoate 2-reductase [Candidatus Sulfomarinibacteraceae bacterium]|nr:2-dehydropantoate 2-reductase [Candidatus Sulfomarinibacteraceae bacterium]